ncbi:MAG: DUF1573 domain-containing protein [Bacteroidetes bacterium]|nr:DUF1573 domain-containing protein [Bacteroidota bacterium]
MKKIVTGLLFLCFVAFSAFSQEEINTNQDTKDHPEIYFENTTHDYGTIEYKGDGTCEFTFKNTGKEPLLLTNVKASCGCTTPTWPKSPIKKGKKGTIVVKYNTRIIGSFTKTIRVYSNAKTSPVTLRITGTVEKPDTTAKN